MTGPFDGQGQDALVFGAGPGSTARGNLGSIRDKAAQFIGVLIIYFSQFTGAEGTYLTPGCIPGSPGFGCLCFTGFSFYHYL